MWMMDCQSPEATTKPAAMAIVNERWNSSDGVTEPTINLSAALAYATIARSVAGVGAGVGHAAPSPRSQQEPHGATRLLPELATQDWTSQRASGNVPVILL